VGGKPALRTLISPGDTPAERLAFVPRRERVERRLACRNGDFDALVAVGLCRATNGDAGCCGRWTVIADLVNA